MTQQRLKKFVPTLEDREWMIKVYNELVEGSHLFTDIGTYQIRNGVLVLTEISSTAKKLGFDDLGIELEIDKMRAIADAVEVKFFDARPTRSK